jgi:hypothetical protein
MTDFEMVINQQIGKGENGLAAVAFSQLIVRGHAIAEGPSGASLLLPLESPMPRSTIAPTMIQCVGACTR